VQARSALSFFQPFFLVSRPRQGLSKVARKGALAIARVQRRRPWEPAQCRWARAEQPRTTCESPPAAPFLLPQKQIGSLNNFLAANPQVFFYF